MKRPRPTTAHLIGCLGMWTTATTTLVFTVLHLHGTPAMRAVISMGTGLALLWCALGGALMRLSRERVRRAVLRVPWHWQVKFVLFSTLLALIEEAVTVSLTNLAPLFGVPVGKAYITASANYLDVVCCHSVVLFVPMFVCWAWLLKRWHFHPNVVFLLFGLTGTLAECSFGWQHLAEFGFWTFVYGLMVYLPACSLPERPGTKTPRLKHHLLALFLPFLFVVPVAGPVSALHPVKIHFPPIGR